MSDTLIGTALQARVQAFQNMTSKKLWFEDVQELRGAAQLALDVAVLADNQGLKDEAAAVMQMLDDLERSAEEEEQARSGQSSERTGSACPMRTLQQPAEACRGCYRAPW
ncbi:TPA: hypothetical protein NIB55_004203 [Pseudomonas aeruginosa]|nr:hypothetical protein [Pseudomonas aeruginosa]